MNFIESHFGEFAALLTALFWTVSAIAFETASRRLGSLSVNILKLVIGLVFLSVLIFLRRKILLPADASPENWIWLTLSGLAGFVFGDLLTGHGRPVGGTKVVQNLLFVKLCHSVVYALSLCVLVVC